MSIGLRQRGRYSRCDVRQVNQRFIRRLSFLSRLFFVTTFPPIESTPPNIPHISRQPAIVAGMVKHPFPPVILDRYAKPISRPGKTRQGLGQQFAARFSEQQNQRKILARYDAAGSSDEFKNYWAPADALDADSANSFHVRANLVKRSRYDIGNNGYSDGIAMTYATDLIGAAPSLRMQTGSEGFNRMVELAWWNWTKEIQFRRKLWCLAHAKHQDGEGFGVLRRNAKLKSRVKLDWVLHETEQCQTPYLPYNKPGQIDGLKFDDFGNATFYDFLKYHPGSN
jgi:hypothetical protein